MRTKETIGQDDRKGQTRQSTRRFWGKVGERYRCSMKGRWVSEDGEVCLMAFYPRIRANEDITVQEEIGHKDGSPYDLGGLVLLDP